MTILDRLFGRTPPVKSAPFKIITGPGVTAYATDLPLSGWLTTDQQRCAAFLKAYKVGWFNKAERKIATDIAGLAWSISTGDVESGSTETGLDRPDLDIPFDALDPIEQLMRLLERPNPFQTGKQLFQRTQIRRDMAGTAFWYLEGVVSNPSGLPTAIYGISPARIWPSYDQTGQLIGYVVDRDKPGGGVPFDAAEIIAMPMAEAEDDRAPVFGVGVVEAVYSELPLTDLMSRHTTDLLTTGGRLAGMLSPKNRALTEDEFEDARRAWRNVASDPNAARRLLLFPEPMEWSAGASTPAEIGIPELGQLNRDNILTSFPIGPEQLGVPMPSGLNASGESRRELDALYWRGTIHPRVDDLEELIQVHLVSRYERVMGQTYDFDLEEPDLDDAATVLEKVAAYKALAESGFDPKESRSAAGLSHIKYLQLPTAMDVTAPPPVPTVTAAPEGLTANVTESRGRMGMSEAEPVAKVTKTRAEERAALIERGLTDGKPAVRTFFEEQRARVTEKVRAFPPKSARLKGLPEDWWDAAYEDQELTATLRGLYLGIGRGSLQIVADQLSKIVPSKSVRRILADLVAYGGNRVTAINENTRNAIKAELLEGIRRGYSLEQLVNGVADESYKGLQGALLDSGVPVWDDYRAEMIARTETMLSANRSAITGYSEFGIEQVQAIDGDGDPECAERDGQVFDVAEADSIEDHPNGTLDWIPVVPVAGEEKSAPDPLIEFAGAIKALAMREQPAPITNFYVQPGPAPDVHLDGTVVNNFVEPAAVTAQIDVSPTPVHVEAPVVQVDVNPTPVSVVNEVAVPTVNVTNEVAAPEVSVVNEVVSPEVHVTNEVMAPEVNVINEVAVPAVTNQVDVHVPQPKPMKRTVKRNTKGEIVSITDGE